jgi:aminoglycoside/choline kinase family phosphotransferase
LRAEFDPHSGLFVLVISDLAPARGGDQLIGASDDEIAGAVSTAARLHASWWGNPSLPGIHWLASHARLVAKTLAQAPDLYPAFAEAWSGELSDEELKLGERVTTRLQPLVDATDHPPYTLVHGDYRLDNLFFAADGEVVVIDWQMSFRGYSGAFDLALLMASSLTSEDRCRLMTPLTQLYRDELVSHGVTDFGETDLRRALAVAAGQLIARCPLAHQIPSANERAATMRARLFRATGISPGMWSSASSCSPAIPISRSHPQREDCPSTNQRDESDNQFATAACCSSG